MTFKNHIGEILDEDCDWEVNEIKMRIDEIAQTCLFIWKCLNVMGFKIRMHLIIHKNNNCTNG